MFTHFGRCLLELLKYHGGGDTGDRQLALSSGRRDACGLLTAHGRASFARHFGFWEQQALAQPSVLPDGRYGAPLDNPNCTLFSSAFSHRTQPAFIYWRVRKRCVCRRRSRVAPDRSTHDQPDAIYVDFLHPAATTSTLASLALRTARRYPCSRFLLPNGRFRIIYEHPIEPPRRLSYAFADSPRGHPTCSICT